MFYFTVGNGVARGMSNNNNNKLSLVYAARQYDARTSATIDLRARVYEFTSGPEGEDTPIKTL